MGFVPGYDNDIFISYAHNDNLPLNGVRWVEKLHDELQTRLTQLLGTSLEIWRDRRLDGTDTIESQLDARIHSSAILLTILSPGYMSSEWCAWERKKFIAEANHQGGLVVEQKSRLVKVVKTTVDHSVHPEFNATLGIGFLREDKAAKKFYELVIGSDEYNQRLEDLAQSLEELLRLLKDRAIENPLPIEKTIYVAETDPSRREQRGTIQRAFQKEYHLLPHEKLPDTVSELEPVVRASLNKATLSIHLLGNSYGSLPDDHPLDRRLSTVHWQHNLAQKRLDDPQFKQLIWIPNGLQDALETSSTQKAFLADLVKESANRKGVHIVDGDLQKLIARVDELMKPPPPPEFVPPPKEESLASVYLICESQDREAAREVERCLNANNCEVLPALPEEKFMQYHQESLRECDAFLVYYNQVGEWWVLMKKLEFMRLSGIRASNKKPVLARAFFITGEKTAEKEEFHSNNALVLRHYDSFSPHVLQPFLNRIRSAKSQLKSQLNGGRP